jgi:ubiquinone/menaquinone biosynthesis C-methylase UbiE
MSAAAHVPEPAGARRPSSFSLRGFADVDAAQDPSALVGALDAGRSSPGMRAIGARMRALLLTAEAGSLLDLGCGPGDDALEMAAALPPGSRVVGVDASRTMILEARRRAAAAVAAVAAPTPRYLAGDAAGLPFPDGLFDRCRAQTLLQHLPDPARAVREIGRVLRPGGLAVAFEFDLGTEFVDHPDMESTRLILDHIAEHALDGWTGRRLAAHYRNAGFVEVEVEAHVVMNTHDMFARTTRPILARLVRDGRLGARRALAWSTALGDLARRGGYLGGSTGFIVTARNPPAACDNTI